MSLESIFNIAGSGLTAQTIRLNTTASNLANARNVAGSPDAVYHAKYVNFAETMADQPDPFDSSNVEASTVKVAGIVDSNEPIQKTYEPGNPLADPKGYIYSSNVNTTEEMTNMISASRDYNMNLEVMNTTKQLLSKTLNILDS